MSVQSNTVLVLEAETKCYFFGGKVKVGKPGLQRVFSVKDPKTNFSCPHNPLEIDIGIYLADVNLKALVKSPVEISSGGNASLKVEKSLEGSLLWKHNEEMLQGLEPHYAFSNADKTELEISDASADQAGMYEVILKVSTCELRKVMEVRISGLCFSFLLVLLFKSYFRLRACCLVSIKFQRQRSKLDFLLKYPKNPLRALLTFLEPRIT